LRRAGASARAPKTDHPFTGPPRGRVSDPRANAVRVMAFFLRNRLRLRQDRLRASRAASALAGLCALAAAGCDDSVAPAPSGQIEGGGGGAGGGGYQTGPIANDVPRTNTGTGFGTPTTPVTPSAGHDGDGNASSASAGASQDFYVAASEAAPKGPAGSPVDGDDRAPETIEKAAAAYPGLVTFDRSAAQTLPAPDPNAPFASIVDPAEETSVKVEGPIELAASGADLDGARFSSPTAGQVVLLTRITEAGRPDRDRLVRYDLAKGDHPSQADLPDRAALLDVSPDGTRALVRLTFGLPPAGRPAASQTRLDVWELTEAEGRHVAGWQPGEKADGPPAVPVGAAFLDGDRVLTLTDDGVLTLWNLAESKAVYSVETGAHGPLVVTPGRKYAAVFTGKTFGAFEVETGAFRGLLASPRQTLAACREAAFSPDGAQLAAVLRRPAQSIVAWDAATGRPAREADAPLGLGRGLHFGSPGYVVAGGVLFDLAAGKPVWLYAENTNCRNLAVSPDRRHWAVTQPAFKVPILEAVEAPTEAVAAAAASAVRLAAPRLGPGDPLAVRLNVPDLAGGKAQLEAGLGKALARVLGERGIRLDPDADLTLVIDADERPTGESISFSTVGIGADEQVPAHEIALTFAVVDKKENTLWGDTGSVPPTTFLAKQEGKSLETVLVEELWRSAPAAIAVEVERAMPAYLRDTPAESVLGQTRLWAGAADVSPPGDASLAANASQSADPNDAVASAPSRQPATTLTVAPSGTVRDLLVASAGVVVSATDDKTVRLWNPQTQQQIDDLKHKAGVTRLAPHPSGTQFVFGTEDGQVRVFELARGSATVALDGAGGAVTAVAVTAEPTVVAGTQAGRVVRWNGAERAKPTVIADGQAAVTGLAAVPYVNRVVVTWADGAAKLIDVGTGEVLFAYDVQAGPVHGVAVAPDTRTAVLATETGGAVRVSLESGEELDRFDTGAVPAVAYRPEGLQLATAGRTGRIVLWNIAGKDPWGRLDGAGGQVNAIVFSTNGDGAAAVVAGRRAVPVWNLSGPTPGGADELSSGAAPGAAHDATTFTRRGAASLPRRPLIPTP